MLPTSIKAGHCTALWVHNISTIVMTNIVVDLLNEEFSLKALFTTKT